MTVKELKIEAKKLGYDIIKIKVKEKLLPCTCGCSRRNHSFQYVNGMPFEILTCQNCGKSVSGKSEKEAVHNWNEMIRKEQDA